MATDKAQTINILKARVLGESLQKDGTNKYGLFSYPPAGISGTGDYDFNKTKKLGTDGKVLTQPRGFYSGPTSSGKVESSYFSKTAYVTIGDKYIDSASRDRQYLLAKKAKNPHEGEFKPSDGTKTDPFKALHVHMSEHNHQKKNYRDANGKVIIPPRNIMTKPAKSGHGDSTVGHLLSKTLPHLADPYNRPQELLTKERAEHKKKLQEAPFRTVSHGNNLFVTTKKTFGKDDKVLAPAKMRSVSPPRKIHESEFKPSHPAKVGYNKTIGKFPEYKGDPIRVAVRKAVNPAEKNDAFKLNNPEIGTRPTPSISINPQNLKNEMARISASLV